MKKFLLLVCLTLFSLGANAQSSTWYEDFDGDGYGNPNSSIEAEGQPTGYVSDNTDCDDSNSTINPLAFEMCNGIDDNCDAQIDNDALDGTVWFTDNDGDGFGDPFANFIVSCTQPPGQYVTDFSDCNDSQLQYADNDNDGFGAGDPVACGTPDNSDCDDTQTLYTDNDGDGFGTGSPVACGVADFTDCDDNQFLYADNDGDNYGAGNPVACGVADQSDCDDTDYFISPDGIEVCNGLDDNCSGKIDEDAVGAPTWYADADLDTYGDPATSLIACDQPGGYVSDNTDCNDADAAVNPSATELCNSVDDNCDGTTDEGCGSTYTYYADSDNDGFGDINNATTTSDPTPPAGYVADNSDCDDTQGSINPTATEVCNTIDDNCDGQIDESCVPLNTYFADTDKDGYGDAFNSLTTIDVTPPAGYVVDNSDCDDNNDLINPAATEVCDNFIDDNCDGSADEGCGAFTYYIDNDGDGFGNNNNSISSSSPTPPKGYVIDNTDCDDTKITYADNDGDGFGSGDPVACGIADNTDCDDTQFLFADSDGDGFGAGAQAACGIADNSDCNDGDSNVNPSATEVCNSVDDNCDGTTDEGCSFTYYADGDSDGFGDTAKPITSSSPTPPAGYAEKDGDCDDGDASINPDASETCNTLDDNCNGQVDENAIDALSWYADTDADGFGDAASSTTACSAPAGYVADNTDCDDAASAVNPGAAEICNGVDDDCDGSKDEDALDATTWYADGDADAYGDATTSITSCDAPVGYTTDNTDCNDADAAVNPAATEVCNGVDDNCDGSTDEGCGAFTYYADTDKDGYGDPGSSITNSDPTPPAGYVVNSDDCDDTNDGVNPAATEVCNGVDDNCDGTADNDAADASVWYADGDSDGFGDATTSATACTAPAGYVADNTDCDDADAAVNPAATEVCNGVDDNCDGTADNDAADASVWYADGDSDGFGDAATSATACTAPAGYVADNTDCDDADAAINPAATEVCNGLDDNCDGTTDNDAADASVWYADGDSDGFGDAATSATACTAPAGYVADNTDCDDADAAVNPSATEVCNGVDDNCDGTADNDAADASVWYADGDSDGFGDAATSTAACTAPAGYVADNTDCNDADAAVNPAATEVCNGVDDNCDGTADNDAADASVWYADGDSDGFGDAATSATACTAPAGYVADNTDCDDADAAVNPAATEVCNGVDDDCDGTTDEGCGTIYTYYADLDGDTYGDAGNTTTSSDPTPPAGYVTDNTDCNDGNSSVNPGASEVCNSTDDDCDGLTDEGVTTTFYRDADGDTYGNASVSTQACAAPSGYVANSTDCNDAIASINPSATEVCNSIDDNCNGQVDEGTSAPSPGAISGQSMGVCSKSTLTYSVTAQAGVSYDWTVPTNAFILSGAGTNSITVKFKPMFISGTITVTLSNNCGSGTSSLNLTSTPPAPASVTGPTSTCKGRTEVYTCSSVAGATAYSWNLPGGWKIISDPSLQTITVKVGPKGGNILASAVNVCGYGLSASLTVGVNCREAEETGSEIPLAVYPNPASEKATINFSSFNSANYQISLTDLTGRVVATREGNAVEGSNKVEIDLNSFAKGIYFVVIRIDDHTGMQRLIIQ